MVPDFPGCTPDKFVTVHCDGKTITVPPAGAVPPDLATATGWVVTELMNELRPVTVTIRVTWLTGIRNPGEDVYPALQRMQADAQQSAPAGWDCELGISAEDVSHFVDGMGRSVPVVYTYWDEEEEEGE